MKPIRVFTHALCEPPGYIARLLDNLKLEYQLVCLVDQETVPMQLDDVSALVFMGGPGNVNEPTSWMMQEMELIDKAEHAGIPVLGICLGAQLMSKALGGEVWQSEQIEVGWHRVSLLHSASQFEVFSALPQEFTVFQWHAHSFTPPANAVSVATSDCTPCQAYVLGPHLALQFHLEMTVDIIMDLTRQYAEDLEGDSKCVQNRAQIMNDIERRCHDSFELADRMLKPWFQSIS